MRYMSHKEHQNEALDYLYINLIQFSPLLRKVLSICALDIAIAIYILALWYSKSIWQFSDTDDVEHKNTVYFFTAF